LEQSNIYINDKGGNHIDKICLDIKRQKQVNNIEIVFIDYLQLIKTDKFKTRDEAIGDITGKLKATAKECNIPIIVISSMNREIEKRGNKKPTLADLRESGSIEFDADIVIFLYENQQNKTDDLENSFDFAFNDGNSEAKKITLSVAKHRNGETTEFDLKFIGKNVKFL